MKVPKIVSADDLSNGSIDELSMMTYLSYFVEPSRAKLLKWVRKTLPHMGVSNLTTDWFDGRCFSALINSCFPGNMANWMKMTSENSRESIAQLYKVSTKRLGIVPHFSADDLLRGRVEELQVMTLIMQIRNGELRSLAEEVVVSGHGLEQARVDKEAFFFIDTTEAGTGKLSIEVYYEDGYKVKFKVEEKVTGVLSLSYTPQILGVIVFSILWSDVPVLKNPFRVDVTDSSLIQILDLEHHSKLRGAGQPIELRVSTERSGRTNLSASLRYEDSEETIAAQLITLEDQVARFRYILPSPGKAVLHIFLNDTELPHLAVPYTVVDIEGYSVSRLPESRVYHTFEEATFVVDSSKGLPLDVLQMVAILTSEIQIEIKFRSTEGNRGVASFKPTLPGVYRIEVVCVDKLINGCPFSVEVSDPLSCKLMGNTPSFLELGKPHVFKLDTQEAGVGDIMFECVDKDTQHYFETVFKEESDGYFKQLQIVPQEEGEFLVGIRYHDQWISGCPFRVRVCDPSKFKVQGDLVEKKMDVIGKPFRFKITSFDIISRDFKPVIKASGPSAKYTPQIRLSEEDSCVLIVSFTPHEIGTHEVSITYGGFHIPSSPFLMAVIDFDSNSCSVTGSGLHEAYTNIPGQFIVLTKTAGLVDDGTLQISVAGVLNKAECQVRIRDNKNGLYNVAYIVTTPGAYLASILARGVHVAGSPFKLHVQPGPEPDKCTMSGPALEEGTVLSIGKPIDFFVNVSQGGTGKLTVKAVGPGGVQARVFMAKSRGKGKGTYDIKIDPTRHGKYRVSVKWAGQHIPNSPFVLKIFLGVDASKCRAHGLGLEDGVVGQPTSFTIETRDAGPGTLKVCLHRVKDAFKIDLKSKDSKDVRTLIARYYPRKPGDYLISILWSEKHIPGSPFKVRITGEALEDDFHPNKYKPTPHTIEELHVIEEEEEDDDILTVDLESNFDSVSVVTSYNNKEERKALMKSSVSLDEMKLPMFSTATSLKGYNETFVPAHQYGPHKKGYPGGKKNPGAGGASKLSSEMLTFSSLQQLNERKHKQHSLLLVASTSESPPLQPKVQSGEFHGQVTLLMRTEI